MARLRAPALALTLALAVQAGTSQAAEAAGATTVQVDQRYLITATLDVAAGRLEAVETLTLTNRAYRSIDHLNLSVIPRALGYLAMDEVVTVDGEEVATEWTTTTNLRVPLPERLAPNAAVEVRIPFRLAVGASGGAFSARLSRDNGVISFGEWFPILSRPHDSYGVGDPQVSYTAEQIRLDLTTTSPLGRHAVACPGLSIAPAPQARTGCARPIASVTSHSWSTRTSGSRPGSWMTPPCGSIPRPSPAALPPTRPRRPSSASIGRSARTRGLTWSWPRWVRTAGSAWNTHEPFTSRVRGSPIPTSSTTKSLTSGSTLSWATTRCSSRGWTRASPTSRPAT